MNIAAALVAQTVPFAGAVVVSNDSAWRDVFTVCYIGTVGLLLSLIAGLDYPDGLTDFIGLSVEALQY